MNSTVEQLIALQKGIAAGHAPALPAGKSDEFYWHPTMLGFGLRLYRNGTATWLIQYRNERRLQSRYKLGDGASLTGTRSPWRSTGGPAPSVPLPTAPPSPTPTSSSSEGSLDAET